MRNFLIVLLAAGMFTFSARADEQTRSVQESLKEQGFYYGSVDGQPGTETTAAIRRYQIRNGLEVSGQLNAETLGSLKVTAKNTPPAITSVPDSNGAPVETDNGFRAPPKTPDRTVVESDRNFLKKSTSPPVAPPRVSPPRVAEDEETQAPPQFGITEENPYPRLFARTPYARAPLEVQRRTFVRAQAYLSRYDFYRGPIDGIPGSGIERAIRDFQVDADLPVSGRLDMDTLAEMRLLPGPDGPFPTERVRRELPSRRTFRGIWIH
jgi:peptidoglycan hydrolase-like protein with peptidoglycan-binding domain